MPEAAGVVPFWPESEAKARSKEWFFVEVTVNVPLENRINGRNRKATSDWLIKLFGHLDRDLTVHKNNGSVVARCRSQSN